MRGFTHFTTDYIVITKYSYEWGVLDIKGELTEIYCQVWALTIAPATT